MCSPVKTVGEFAAFFFICRRLLLDFYIAYDIVLKKIMEGSFMNSTCVIILGGGRGTRLYPLVKERSKPAVPLGGKYRMIDIPLSNCINSGLRQIFVLTQFRSASLNNHITRTYNFDMFTNGFVHVLAAEQTEANMDWFQGTADAVRKHIAQFDKAHYDKVLILSGDQIYRMDYRLLIKHMDETNADIIVGNIPVKKSETKAFGIMQMNAKGKITSFVEKPQEEEVLAEYKLSAEQKKAFELKDKNKDYLASMGIYLFKKDLLLEMLEDNSMMDFGKDIIPAAIDKYSVQNYAFDGYWEDVGTVKAFFEANVALASKNPPFDFDDENMPIFTHARFLSGTKLDKAEVEESLISDGCNIGSQCSIKKSVIGVRSIIREGSQLNEVVMMGSDSYESTESKKKKSDDLPYIGVGKNCVLNKVIIDKNVRIGDNVVIENKKNVKNQETAMYSIRDGVVVIPKNTVIKSGTVI